jgi:hypothetical protein
VTWQTLLQNLYQSFVKAVCCGAKHVSHMLVNVTAPHEAAFTLQ